MTSTVGVGVAVAVMLFVMAWGFRRFGMLGGIVITIIALFLAGSLVAPIRATVNGAIDTARAPLDAAKQLINGKGFRWGK